MSEELRKLMYEKLTNFLRIVSAGDADLLFDIFGISKPILDEIEESLIEYFNNIQPMSLAPYDVAFNKKGKDRPFFDAFEMNDPNFIGVECVIFVNEKETEAILHVEFEKNEDDLNFKFKYIGS